MYHKKDTKIFHYTIHIENVTYNSNSITIYKVFSFTYCTKYNTVRVNTYNQL